MAAATMAGRTAALLVVLAGLVNIGSGAPMNTIPNSEFCANNTLVGKSISCTEKQKTCLIANMLYRDYGNGKETCIPFGWNDSGRYQDDCLYVANRDEFEDHNHLVASCRHPNQCRNNNLLMAYNGICMGRNICGGLTRSPHLFGGDECNCPKDMEDAMNQQRVLQPTEKDRCTIPDFSVDLQSDRINRTFPAKVTCPSSWKNCSKNEVWYKGSCEPLLEMSDHVCLSGYVLMLEAHGFGSDHSVPQSNPAATAKCVRNDMGCQAGRIRLAIDTERCHDQTLFMYGVKLHRDAFGYYHLLLKNETRRRNEQKLFECVRSPKSGTSRSNNRRKNLNKRRVKKLRHHSNIRRS